MPPPEFSQFYEVTSALAYALAEPAARTESHQAPFNDLTAFIIRQHSQMPDYLRWPMQAAALAFDAQALATQGGCFRHLPLAARQRHIKTWKHSSIGVQRDFIRYFESLALFALFTRENDNPDTGPLDESLAGVIQDPPDELRARCVVIGSGPGGAITACCLAEAGHDTLLVEEGRFFRKGSCPPFSREEMLQKYRNGGQTVAMGANKISYVEGRCVGGGSEINSGLYHRTPPDILERWRAEFKVDGLTEADLRPHFEACERDLSVGTLPCDAPPASLKLRDGASRLGWSALEIPRWYRYAKDDPPAPAGARQSMSQTYVPRFLRAGGKLLTETRALGIRQEGGRWTVEAARGSDRRLRVVADSLFLCAGAVHTPALLWRSGFRNNIGQSLQVHPTAKIVAEFPEQVNFPGMGVPVHQVKEFSPRISMGCSISSPSYLALGLLDHPGAAQAVAETWNRQAIYYAMITSEGRGTVRTLPGFRDPLVRYALTPNDRAALAEGLRKLAEILFEAGAALLYPAISGATLLRTPEDVARLPQMAPEGKSNLMTIHLFSSCPMGEDKMRCAADSFGCVHGATGLYINDASLLCTAPGVNPQGSIMALARRNALYHLDKMRLSS